MGNCFGLEPEEYPQENRERENVVRLIIRTILVLPIDRVINILIGG